MPASPLTTPFLPETAPFTAEQRAWFNGYLAGLISADRLVLPGATAVPAAAVATKSLLILYGSQTGTAEGLAGKFAREAKKKGFGARALSLEDHASIDFTAESRLAVVTSTYGDGEMPDNAQAFWKLLQSESAPNFKNTEFSVLALGDTNYAQFCQAGKNFDQRLAELGAKRIQDRVDCDLDYETPAQSWFEGLLQSFSVAGDSAAVLEPEPISPMVAKEAAEVAVKTGYSKANPFPAKLKESRKLTGDGSAKDVRHVEIILEGSGLNYSVGDALGVVPANCSEFVQEILTAAGLDGEESVVTPSGQEKPLRLALTVDYDLKPLLAELPAPGTTATEIVAKLKKIQPRLYSISSSPKAHAGEVHLTVGVVRYELNGRPRKGACSTYLADRVGDSLVPVFVHSSPSFKPPTDPNAPMIMVGPGTGIAPFRAFLEEREATGATGRNWLFFGDQCAATDFLYREQLEGWKASGFLTRLDLAFSRDQAEKIYVQQRMLEQAQELWSWLEAGASFYVCGDAKRMAKDVDAALHEVCATAGGLGAEGAIAYVAKLKTEKRYARDVY